MLNPKQPGAAFVLPSIKPYIKTTQPKPHKPQTLSREPVVLSPGDLRL